jgi:hypothetical protein
LSEGASWRKDLRRAVQEDREGEKEVEDDHHPHRDFINPEFRTSPTNVPLPPSPITLPTLPSPILLLLTSGINPNTSHISFPHPLPPWLTLFLAIKSFAFYSINYIF